MVMVQILEAHAESGDSSYQSELASKLISIDFLVRVGNHDVKGSDQHPTVREEETRPAELLGLVLHESMSLI